MDNFLTNREKISCGLNKQECAQMGGSNVENLAPFNILHKNTNIQHPLVASEEDKAAKIETVYENGTLRKVIVTCSCGKEMIFLCNYT